MSVESALGATVGLIPITMGAGIAMKFTERMFPGQQRRRSPRRQRRANVLRQSYRPTGKSDFSNVGF